MVRSQKIPPRNILVEEAADILTFMEKVRNVSLLLKEMLENQGVDYTIKVFEGLVVEAVQTNNQPLEKTASAIVVALKKKYKKES